MSDADAAAVWDSWYARHFAMVTGMATPWLRGETRAAIDATNDWIQANQASYVSSLTTAAPNVAAGTDATQKTLLFAYVALRRAGIL